MRRGGEGGIIPRACAYYLQRQELHGVDSNNGGGRGKSEAKMSRRRRSHSPFSKKHNRLGYKLQSTGDGRRTKNMRRKNGIRALCPPPSTVTNNGRGGSSFFFFSTRLAFYGGRVVVRPGVGVGRRNASKRIPNKLCRRLKRAEEEEEEEEEEGGTGGFFKRPSESDDPLLPPSLRSEIAPLHAPPFFTRSDSDQVRKRNSCIRCEIMGLPSTYSENARYLVGLPGSVPGMPCHSSVQWDCLLSSYLIKSCIAPSLPTKSHAAGHLPIYHPNHPSLHLLFLVLLSPNKAPLHQYPLPHFYGTVESGSSSLPLPSCNASRYPPKQASKLPSLPPSPFRIATTT